jgi:hypothetical protein
MTMNWHKLSAGSGYQYLTRQVAASDDSNRGRGSLSDYYSAKGEAPGRWMGRGLAALGQPADRELTDPEAVKLWSVTPGSIVAEEQMRALYGEGLHPNADQIAKYVTERGGSAAAASHATKLGRPFYIYEKENEWITRLRAAYQTYNTTLGQDSYTSLDPETKGEIRTALGREMFGEEYDREPKDERELTGYIARVSRSPEAVAAYDATFSPVKSESALWAIAPPAIRRKIEWCNRTAVAETIDFMENEAAFTRMGANGVAQFTTTGLIVAVFEHRDSRAGDPHHHLHACISNKVCAVGPDGLRHWLALDGERLYKIAVAASEFYNTRREALMIEHVGVRYEEVPSKDGPARGGDKRPVREIVAPPELQGAWAELQTRWSSRHAAIEHRQGELAKEFQVKHGREPTAIELLALDYQAHLDTRQAKHAPRSAAEQFHSWGVEAVEVLGHQRDVARMVAGITSERTRRTELTDEWVAEQAARVIDTVSRKHPQWQRNRVYAEAQRLLRYAQHPGGREVVDRIVAAALANHCVAITTDLDSDLGEPEALRRPDGTSVFARHDSTTYSSPAIIAAERRILEAADQRDGRVVDETGITLALLEYHAQRGVELNAGQAAMVRAMATSGARLQLGLAPAATGKTTAMGPLATAVRNSGGSVLGLASSATAAAELAEGANIETCDTIAKLVQLAFPELCPIGPAKPDDPAWKWFNAIGPDTFIIVDEAGMTSTRDLDIVRAVALARGASVRLIGDDRQLPSIDAGGILRNLADHADTVTLTEVVRFVDEAQGAASLALREGDPAAIAYYIDHERIHVGHDEMAADMVFRAWAADRAAGRPTLMLAPTTELTDDLNQRGRLLRLAGADRAPTVTVTLGDGLTASAGDWVTTRKNARWLRPGPHADRYVKNGHRWVVQTVHSDGSLTVSPLRDKPVGWTVRLPADYVKQHTTLGYARTINAAEGITTGNRRIEGNCHLLITEDITAQQFYVGMTRGTGENHGYGSTSEADPHRIIFQKATHPPTLVEIVEAILRRDGSQVSAHTVMEADVDPVAGVHRAAEDYLYAVGGGAEHLAGPEVMARIDRAAANIDGTGTGVCFSDCAGWPVLRHRLAMLAIEGRDPVEDLREAVDSRPLGDARDKAAVLEWRFSEDGAMENRQPGPLQWLPRIPDPLAQHPQWGPFLARRSELISELANRIRTEASGWDHTTAPGWARPVLGRTRLLAELAVFRATHGIEPADTRLTGPKQHRVRSAKVQRALNKRVANELTYDHPGIKRWHELAEQVDTHIPRDPYWPQLAVRLDDAARAGADVAQLFSTAMEAGPLPDEQPAAALWWRLYGTLAPASLHGTGTQLRPPWMPELHHIFGSAIAEAIVTDPSWPRLVASVTASAWLPHELLAAAAEHLHDVAATEGLRPDQYALLLTYRINLLAHHATVDQDVPHPAKHAEPADEHLISEDDVAQEHHEAPPYDYAEALETDAGERAYGDPPLPPAALLDRDEDVDIPALRARRDDARRRAEELAELMLRGCGGPAEQAAAVELAELRARQEQQRPYQEALARAHAEWLAADEDSGRIGDDSWPRVAEARSLLVYVAGGAHNIVTDRDIAARRERALRADRDALQAARAEHRDLDNQLVRAEVIAARAFAEAEIRRSGYIAESIELLRAELNILAVAADEVASPVRIPASRLAGLSDAAKTLLPALARLPFALIPVRALPGEQTDQMVHALERAAAVAGGRVIRCSPTSDLDIPDPVPEHSWVRVHTYNYPSVEGRPVQQVLREECHCDGSVHKQFRQRYRDGQRWVWKQPANFTPVLYRAPELTAADPYEFVWLTEGEKDADTAAGLGLVATTNAQGAGSFPPQLAAQLAGRRVAVVIDRDLAGFKRALALHEQLSDVASELRFLLPATTQAKTDLTDHVAAGLWDASLPFGGLQETTRDALALRANQLQQLDAQQPVLGPAAGLGRVLDRPDALSSGGLLIVQDPADAQPAALVDVVTRAAASHAQVILVDTAPAWPLKPSGRLVGLLHTDIPWSAALDAPALIQAQMSAAEIDLAPLVAQAAHLPASQLNQDLGQVLADREQARAAAWDAKHRYIESSWQDAEHTRDRQRDRGHGLEL